MNENEHAEPLDLRDFDEIDADEAEVAVSAREALTGLPARPGTIR